MGACSPCVVPATELLVDEVITHLVGTFGPEPTHKLIRVLDSDADGSITREEWHRGWRSSQFEVEENRTYEAGTAGNPRYKLSSRHLTRSNLLGTDETKKGSKKNVKKAASKQGTKVVPSMAVSITRTTSTRMQSPRPGE